MTTFVECLIIDLVKKKAAWTLRVKIEQRDNTPLEIGRLSEGENGCSISSRNRDDYLR